MEVIGTRHRIEAIHINEAQQKEVVRKFVKTKYDWKFSDDPNPDHYGYQIRDGNVIESWEEHFGPRSSTEDRIVRFATYTDHAIWHLIQEGILQ